MWLSEAVGARHLPTAVKLLCLRGLAVSAVRFLRVLLGPEGASLESVALTAVCSCCGGQGPAGARWRPGRWSSLQHFSCLDPGGPLTSKLDHSDREHCDLWHNFLPSFCWPSREEGAQFLSTNFPCPEGRFFLNPETDGKERWGKPLAAAFEHLGSQIESTVAGIWHLGKLRISLWWSLSPGSPLSGNCSWEYLPGCWKSFKSEATSYLPAPVIRPLQGHVARDEARWI